MLTCAAEKEGQACRDKEAYAAIRSQANGTAPGYLECLKTGGSESQLRSALQPTRNVPLPCIRVGLWVNSGIDGSL